MAPNTQTLKDSPTPAPSRRTSRMLVIPVETWKLPAGLRKSYENLEECDVRVEPGGIPCLGLVMRSGSTVMKHKLATTQGKEKIQIVKLGFAVQVDTLRTCIQTMHTGLMEIFPDQLLEHLVTLRKLEVEATAFSDIASAITGDHSALCRFLPIETLFVLMEALHKALEIAVSSSSTPDEQKKIRSTLFALAVEIASKFEEENIDSIEKLPPQTAMLHWYYLCAIFTENTIRTFNIQRRYFPYFLFDNASKREFLHEQVVYRDTGVKLEPTKETAQVMFSMSRQEMFLLFSKWSVNQALENIYKSPSPIELIHLAKLSVLEITQCFYEFCARKEMKLHRPFLSALRGPVECLKVPDPNVTSDSSLLSLSKSDVTASPMKVVDSQAPVVELATSSKRREVESTAEESDDSSEAPSSSPPKKGKSSAGNQPSNTSKASGKETKSYTTTKKNRTGTKTKKTVQTP